MLMLIATDFFLMILLSNIQIMPNLVLIKLSNSFCKICEGCGVVVE